VFTNALGLRYDCAKYRNADEGPRTTNESLWAAWEAEEACVLDATRWLIQASPGGGGGVTIDSGRGDNTDKSVVDDDFKRQWVNLPTAVSDALTSSYRVFLKSGGARENMSNLKMDGKLYSFDLAAMVRRSRDNNSMPRIRPPLDGIADAPPPAKTQRDHKLAEVMHNTKSMAAKKK
jgi:hypothetical protein